MTYKEFAVLYTAQLKISELYSSLLIIEYPNQPFITQIEKEAGFICGSLGGGYFEDSFWLKEPLSPEMAYQIWLRQNSRK